MIVDASPDIELKDEAASGPELLEKLGSAAYDVIILDISLPGGLDGLDLVHRLRAEHPRTAILILSMHPEHQFAVRALRAGAAGYVMKASLTSELLSAIRKVAGGGKHVTPAVAEELAFAFDEHRQTHPQEELSDREFSVMRALAIGKGPAEIASELCLSVSTVGTYRSRILSKLRLSSTADLIRYAVTHHLVDE